MKRIPIDKASAAQLAAFATLHLGLDVEDGASAAKIRAAIARAGYERDHIEIVDEAAPAGQKQQAFDAHAAGPRPDKVRIVIQRQPGPGGDRPVPIGVNGSVMYVPRGEECEIPYRYFHALQNAVQYEFDPDDRDGLKPPRKIPSYPFSVIGPH